MLDAIRPTRTRPSTQWAFAQCENQPRRPGSSQVPPLPLPAGTGAALRMSGSTSEKRSVRTDCAHSWRGTRCDLRTEWPRGLVSAVAASHDAAEWFQPPAILGFHSLTVGLALQWCAGSALTTHRQGWGSRNAPNAGPGFLPPTPGPQVVPVLRASAALDFLQRGRLS